MALSIAEMAEIGWPQGDYVCKCHKCNKRFFGPKRAWLCWKHAPHEMRIWWIKRIDLSYTPEDWDKNHQKDKPNQ